MYFNWSKFIFALIYLILSLLVIAIQPFLPLNTIGLVIGLALTITALFSNVLFASSIISAFSRPLETPNIAVALVSTILAILLFLTQIYLFIRQIIDFLTLIFPK